MMRATENGEAALFDCLAVLGEGLRQENTGAGLSAKDKEDRALRKTSDLQNGLTVAAGCRSQSLVQDQGRRALPYGGTGFHSGRGRCCCATFSALGRKIGCEGDSSLFIRRIAAALRFARGVFFGGYRMAYAPFTGVPGGKPSGLPFPNERSVNLPGAALPLTGVGGSFNLSLGA